MINSIQAIRPVFVKSQENTMLNSFSIVRILPGSKESSRVQYSDGSNMLRQISVDNEELKEKFGLDITV